MCVCNIVGLLYVFIHDNMINGSLVGSIKQGLRAITSFLVKPPVQY